MAKAATGRLLAGFSPWSSRHAGGRFSSSSLFGMNAQPWAIYRLAAACEMTRDRGQFAATVRAAREPLLPIPRRPTPLTDRIVLALELAGPCAAEVTLALKVIDERWGVTPYEPIAGAGHARRRIMAYGLGESWRPRYSKTGLDLRPGPAGPPISAFASIRLSKPPAMRPEALHQPAPRANFPYDIADAN